MNKKKHVESSRKLTWLVQVLSWLLLEQLSAFCSLIGRIMQFLIIIITSPPHIQVTKTMSPKDKGKEVTGELSMYF